LKKSDNFLPNSQSISVEAKDSFREINDIEWAKILHLFDHSNCGKTKLGRPRINPREVLNAILWIRCKNQSWLLLPSSYPSASSCKLHFKNWQKLGLLEEVSSLIGETMPSIKLCLDQKNIIPKPQHNRWFAMLNGIDHPVSK
jgi:hypothetical protein